jgi:hypothetical protein
MDTNKSPCTLVQEHVEMCSTCQSALRCSPFEKQTIKCLPFIELIIFIVLIVAVVWTGMKLTTQRL